MTKGMYLPVTYPELSEALRPKPFLGEGTDSVDPLFAEVGRVCASFEAIEGEIVLLFQVLCGGPAVGISNMARIIGVTSSNRAKIELTEEAAKAFLASEPGKMKAVLAWLKLCRQAADIRNKIAHGHPSQYAFVHKGRSRQAAFLLPSPFDPRKIPASGRWSGSAYCWNARQLQEYNVAFQGLRAMMMTVREELAGTAEEPQPHVLRVHAN
jgi:hypothetical protein